MTPFPPCSQTTWGVRETASRYGLEPLQRGAVFQTTDGGLVELRLQTSDDRQLRFTTKLTAYGGEDGRVARTVDGALIHRVVGDVATFSFRFISTQHLRRRSPLCRTIPFLFAMNMFNHENENQFNNIQIFFYFVCVCVCVFCVLFVYGP